MKKLIFLFVALVAFATSSFAYTEFQRSGGSTNTALFVITSNAANPFKNVFLMLETSGSISTNASFYLNSNLVASFGVETSGNQFKQDARQVICNEVRIQNWAISSGSASYWGRFW